MSRTTTRIRRGGTVLGATIAAVALAAPSYAHHCYKDAWTDAAHAAVSNGTAWMSMTDMVTRILGEEFELPEVCVAHSGEFVQSFMTAKGLTQEPLIHSRTTVAGGAAHKKGFEPKPFSYLTDADFGILVDALAAEPDCQPPAEED